MAVPFSKYSCTLSNTRTWIVPSVKAMPKNWLFCSLKRASASTAWSSFFLLLLLLMLSSHCFYSLVVSFLVVSRADILWTVQVFAQDVKHTKEVAPERAVLNLLAIANADTNGCPILLQTLVLGAYNVVKQFVLTCFEESLSLIIR